MVRLGASAVAVSVGALLGFGLFFWARVEEPAEGGAAPAASKAAAPVARAVSDVPRIDLGRIESPPAASRAGARDVFGYGSAERRAAVVASDEALPPVMAAPASIEPAEPVQPAAPSLNVKFIGSVDRGGAKFVVLMTDRKEILTARAGEVVANRLRVVKIGIESVDVQDVGGGAVRRLPLRAN